MRDADLRRLAAGAVRLAGRAGDEAFYAAACVRSGVLGLEPPGRLARIGAVLVRHGMIAGALGAGALRHPDRVAVRDDRGELTYGQLERRSNALAHAWRARGLRAGDGVGLLVRNHAGFLEAAFAAAKCGAKLVALNTAFAPPQVRDVIAREGVDLLVADDDLMAALDGLPLRLGAVRAWAQGDDQLHSIDSLVAAADPGPVPRPARPPPGARPGPPPAPPAPAGGGPGGGGRGAARGGGGRAGPARRAAGRLGG